MSILRTTSAETAARFIASRGNRLPKVASNRAVRRATEPARRSTGVPSIDRILAKRITLDLAAPTLSEIMDCVVDRVMRLRSEDKPVPHITQIALKMLHEAINVPARPPICDERKEPGWKFLEKHVPGIRAAWERDVRLPAAEFSFGITGKPSIGVATDRQCYDPAYKACRCRRFIDGRWELRGHLHISQWGSK